MPTAPRRYRTISADDYLAGDNDGQWRHEFIDGVVYPMPEFTADHNLLSGDILVRLAAKHEPRFDVFSGGFKLRIKNEKLDRFYYPDVFVTHRSVRDDAYFATDAVLVVEVLSPETERLDRTKKFEAYRQLPSMMEYALFSTDTVEVEMFRRRSGWKRELYLGPSIIQFETVEFATNVSNFYKRMQADH